MMRIYGARVIDPARSIWGEKIELALSGGKFVSVSSLPVGAVSMDLSGRWITPGLIDCHVHCTFDPGAARRRVAHSALELEENARRNLAVAIRSCVTTVRDLGSQGSAAFRVRSEWEQGRIVGARPLLAGEMITTIGGHGTEMAYPCGYEIRGVEEARQAVDVMRSRGADGIKLVTCGYSTEAELSLAELSSAVEAAHLHGMNVACHAHFREASIWNAVCAGCDTIEHGFALSERIIDTMLRRGVFLVPTFSVLRSILEEPERFNALGTFLARLKHDALLQEDSFRRAITAGVRVAAGTDAGVTGVFFDALLDELAFMEAGGMTRRQSLQAATSNAAAAVGRTDLGSVQDGSVGDFTVLASNPLEDLDAFRHPIAVFQNGALRHGEL